MKKIILLFLFLCNSLYSQSPSNLHSSGDQIDFFKSNFNDLKDKIGNNIFDSNQNDSLIFSGQAIGNNFGFSVSSAGDVNGDGYSDIVVGATGYSTGRGRAYIYYGGPSIDNTADVVMTGETFYSYFGFKVSNAGDVNNDGYSDVIIGSPGYSNTGKVYIFFGGVPMDNVPDITMTGFANSFGWSVSNAGDVNGDGYSDVIVGDYVSNQAHIYLGGSPMNDEIDITMMGENAMSGSFGFRVTSAGDVNGDGYSDVIVSDASYDARGRAYIYYGSTTMNSVADVIITGEIVNNAFGYSVSSAGDANGDGYSDVIVGSQGSNVYLFYGGSIMNNTIDLILPGGQSISTAGDVNWDGYSDIIIGSLNSGIVNIFYGGLNMNNISDIFLSSEFAGDHFGSSVSTAGDVNGDGYFDIIIGADSHDNQKGRAYLYKNLVPKPQLINPVKNSINNPVDINFKWRKFNGAFHYVLNVSTDSLFNNIIVNDTIFIDTSRVVTGFLRETKYFWRVMARDTLDFTYNSMEWSFTTVPSVQINIEILFEGLYYPAFNQLIRKDSVLVYLRQSSSPFSIQDSAKTTIDSNLFTGFLKFYFTPTGTYYLTIKHFNSIETWSKSGGEYIVNDGLVFNYDFTSSNTQAYGNNLKLKGSKYCLYSGDINQDGFITLFDVIPIYNNSSNFVTGNYLTTDLTGDGIVDLADVTLCYNNSINFIRVRKP